LFLLAVPFTYQKAPPAIHAVLEAPAPPLALLSPSRDYLLLGEPRRYPTIAELAEPMLALAGERIHPGTNGPHRAIYWKALAVKKIAGGTESRVALPPDPRLRPPEWSPDGKRFAFLLTTPAGIEVWLGDTTGRASRLRGGVNAAYGDPLRWMPDSKTLLLRLIPEGRGRPPQEPRVPSGPHVQEGSGKASPARTYQDLLKNSHDEALWDYYATAQLALVDAATGKTTPVGRPAIFGLSSPSPDAGHLLVARLLRPYSYLHPASAFGREIEVWNLRGEVVHRVATLPLADQVPLDGVRTGPREYGWRPSEPVTLAWIEALDGGDPKKPAPHRDRLMLHRAPFTDPPVEVIRTEHRITDFEWGERDGLLVREYDRRRVWRRVFLVDPEKPSQPRLLWSLNARERYKHPGEPLKRALPNGHPAIAQSGDWIFLKGDGATPEGQRPFLDRYNWRTGETVRLFRSPPDAYETVEALLAGDAWLARRESATEPPNYWVRAPSGLRALTKFPDPAPPLRAIRKKLVAYRRPDGVPLSFTLYLPPGYQEGRPLPTLLWAYPREYTDPETAGQVSGSDQRFTMLSGASHLYLLLAGYAILDDASLPVVGDPETVNNTYIEQIVSGAQAAVDKAVEMGWTDRRRVAVAGHSYGGFMTANLLAHSDLFRAGIARSGAYNRTLTPFGFQSERRTFWEAPELYLKMSPFVYAHKINEPLLLIHGEADNNAGTFPVQSERLYHAVRGHGGTVRLVLLPHESHGYAARESVEHVLAEMAAWLDRWLSGTPNK
jgi:dipeptidyl aminopeptidase/acylaminoacyl peptidase